MNIKELIEAGAYPKDDKGRSLVPLRSGKIATIYATDCPVEDEPICGAGDIGGFPGISSWGPTVVSRWIVKAAST